MKETAERVDCTRMLSVKGVACRLSISARTVYGLAAPGGPIPCYRIGRRVLFRQEDLQAYLESCRHVEVKVDSSLLSTSLPKLVARAPESELEKYFRERGLKPSRLPPGPRS